MGISGLLSVLFVILFTIYTVNAWTEYDRWFWYFTTLIGFVGAIVGIICVILAITDFTRLKKIEEIGGLISFFVAVAIYWLPFKYLGWPWSIASALRVASFLIGASLLGGVMALMILSDKIGRKYLFFILLPVIVLSGFLFFRTGGYKEEIDLLAEKYYGDYKVQRHEQDNLELSKLKADRRIQFQAWQQDLEAKFVATDSSYEQFCKYYEMYSKEENSTGGLRSSMIGQMRNAFEQHEVSLTTPQWIEDWFELTTHTPKSVMDKIRNWVSKEDNQGVIFSGIELERDIMNRILQGVPVPVDSVRIIQQKSRHSKKYIIDLCNDF